MSQKTDKRVITLSLAQLAESVGNSFIIIVLPLYIATEVGSSGFLGMDEVMITGVVLSLAGFVSSFVQPFSGAFSDSVQRRKVFVLAGLGVLTVANAAYAFAETYPALFAVRALQGFAGALIVPAAVALVSEYSTMATRGGNIGVYNTFRLVGFAAGPIVAGAVVNAGPYSLGVVAVDGFSAAFYLAAVGSAISLLLVSVFIHDPEPKAEARRRVKFRIRDGNGGLDPVFTLGLATFFMAVGVALFATLQVSINTRLDQGATAFGLQFSALLLPFILFQTAVGRASDSYGRKRFIVLGLVLLAPTTFVQGVVTTSTEMFVARFFQGVAGTFVFAPALALAGDLARGDTASKLAVLTMAFGFGVAIGPLSSGFLVAFGFVVPFAFGAALAVVGAVLVHREVEETVGNETEGETEQRDVEIGR